jgi:hypothetical protein
MGRGNGQWLDDEAAAGFLRQQISALPANVKTHTGTLPDGFPARVINGDGTFSTATRFTMVRGKDGIKTAYPEL